jgi:predicted nicotinamide N-methyase
MDQDTTRNGCDDRFKANDCAEYDAEIHWIESESLFATQVAATLSSSTRVDSGEDMNLYDLFIDPDPYETFTLQWKIVYQNDTREIIDRTSCISQYRSDVLTAPITNAVNGQITAVGNKAENGQTLHSTGLTLWRAARIITDYLVSAHNNNALSLLQQPISQQEHRQTHVAVSTTFSTPPISAVLELGCGLGLPSMLYHYYLSSHDTHTITIATDADVQTLENVRHNFVLVQQEQEQLSQLNPHYRHHYTTTTMNRNFLTSQQLIWGNTTHIRAVLSKLHSFRSAIQNKAIGKQSTSASNAMPLTSVVKVMDHNQGQEQMKFDLILGSDIIYVEHVVEPLFDTVHELLLHDGGTFVLAFARRNVSIDYVLEIAHQKGFSYEYVEPVKIQPKIDMKNAADTVDTNGTTSSMEGVYIFRILPWSK